MDASPLAPNAVRRLPRGGRIRTICGRARVIELRTEGALMVTAIVGASVFEAAHRAYSMRVLQRQG